MVREIIDDSFYFDDTNNELFSLAPLQNHPWIHIIVKVWAKLNQGYELLENMSPFSFIKTFTFPDWEIINPGK